MSFGGGDSPSGTTFQTQFTRDAPQIEAAKMGLMDTAQQYTRFGGNPWELADRDAKMGDDLFGQYRYMGDARDHRWDPTGGAEGTGEGRLFRDLSRGERAEEGQAGGLGGIPTQQVAGFDPLQEKAFGRRFERDEYGGYKLDAQGKVIPTAEGDPLHWQNSLANQGIGAYQGLLNQAQDLTQQSTQAYDPMSYQQYMNPYQDEVIAGIEQQFGKAGAGLDLQAAKAGSFGGARQGIQAAELAGQQATAVGQAQAQNYGQAQAQAQQQFASQMGRYGQAGQQMAGLGAQQQQQQLGDIASLMSAGSVQQQQNQQILDADYQQKLQQLYEPYQRLGFTSDIYQGMPSSAMAISMGTSPGSNPLAQTVGAGIAGLGAYQGFKAGG